MTEYSLVYTLNIMNAEYRFITCSYDKEIKHFIIYMSIFITFDHLVVGKMQVEQEKHVESCQGSTQNETRSFTHSAGNQHGHLREKVGGKEKIRTELTRHIDFCTRYTVWFKYLSAL